MRFQAIETDDKVSGRIIFCNYNVVFQITIGGQADAFTLSDGVSMQTAVMSDNFSVEGYNIPRSILNVFFKKIVNRYTTASKEANALAILALCVRQADIGGNAPELNAPADTTAAAAAADAQATGTAAASQTDPAQAPATSPATGAMLVAVAAGTAACAAGAGAAAARLRKQQ